MSFWFGDSFEHVEQLLWLAPLWKILVGIACGILSIGLLWWHRPKQGKNILEMFFWTLAIAVLVLINAQPHVVSFEGEEIQGKIIALIDESASMSVEENGQTRLDLAQKTCKDLQKELGGEWEILYFSEQVHSEQSKHFGEQSDVLQALQNVSDRYLGLEARAVFLLTDGIDRSVLHSLTQDGKAIQIPKLPGPLNIIQIGSEKPIFDEAVTSIQTGDYAFQRTNFTIKANVQGEPNSELTVHLLKNNQKEALQKVLLNDQGEGLAEFVVRPLDVGRFAWEIQIPVSPLDVVPSNNYFPVVIKVVRDEVRVLQVSGSPSYDQKFLRLFLKEDPSVDLISFFILRTHEDFSSGWDSDELSLIAFPYERLFSEDLPTFDLVIFQNFDYEPFFTYQSTELLQNIADYVRNGGAFVMTGGDRSFDLGKYANTPIENILPVTLGVTETSSHSKFVPILATEGSSHPITQLASSPEESRRIWEDLPMMDGFNRVMGMAPDSAMLLQHPTAKDMKKSPHPILAVREVGKGRVMSLGIDSSWRWSYSEALEGGGNQAYLRFWKNAIRWLIADPEDANIVIVPSKENAMQSEEMTLKIRSRDVGYQPKANVTLAIEIVSPSGEKFPFSSVTDVNGEAMLNFTPQEQGVYAVSVQQMGKKEPVQTVFAVSSRMAELQNIQPNISLMQHLNAIQNEKGQGKWMSLNDLSNPLVKDDSVRSIPQKQIKSIGQAPIAYVWMASFFFAAMWLRRRSGGR